MSSPNTALFGYLGATINDLGRNVARVAHYNIALLTKVYTQKFKKDS